MRECEEGVCTCLCVIEENATSPSGCHQRPNLKPGASHFTMPRSGQGMKSKAPDDSFQVSEGREGVAWAGCTDPAQ